MRKALDGVQIQSTAITVDIHIPLQILFTVLHSHLLAFPLSREKLISPHLENEDKLRFGMNNIVQADNVYMLKLYPSR